MHFVLYIHILSATAWIGGSLLLFALGVLLRDKAAQKQTYEHLGPIYGWFEMFWLLTLWITGTLLYMHHGFGDVFKFANASELSRMMHIKVYLVIVLTILTFVHLVIAFKTHMISRTKWQQLLSRGSSLGIFLLNLVILWFAVGIRSML
jgi:uncharacterized membrane protein